VLTLNLPTTTIVAQPFNIIKWQLIFNLVDKEYTVMLPMTTGKTIKAISKIFPVFNEAI